MDMLTPDERSVWSAMQGELRDYVPNAQFPDDAAAKLCIAEALAALDEGNFGIGAVLLDPEGRVANTNHNRVFAPHFRSDAHAEMMVVNTFEELCSNHSLRGYTLYTSLEPCPMCMARLITSGISRVFHVADDQNAGMVHLAHQLPLVWQSLAERQRFKLARCSPALKALATKAFMLNVARLDKKLCAR